MWMQNALTNVSYSTVSTAMNTSNLTRCTTFHMMTMMMSTTMMMIMMTITTTTVIPVLQSQPVCGEVLALHTGVTI